MIKVIKGRPINMIEIGENHWNSIVTERNHFKARIIELESALEEAKLVLEQVWDEYECGWIVDEPGNRECAKCGLFTPNHLEDCIQAPIEKTLSAINKAIRQLE